MCRARKYPPLLRHAGFSLLEVLVALSILSLSLGVLMPSFGNFSRSTALSGDFRQAMMIAESRLAAAVATREYDASGVDAGRFAWEFGYAPFEFDDAVTLPAKIAPLQIVIVVTWTDGRKTRSLSLTTVQLGSGRSGL